MKKLLVTVFVLSVCYTINAQNDKQQNEKLRFGVKAGLNFANTTGNGLDFFFSSDESPENRLGLTLGGLVEYRVSEKFSVQSELTYSQQGFREDYSDEDYVETYVLNYLNIPLLAKYYISDEFNLEVGPQIGFLLAAKYKENDEGEKYEEDAKEFFKSSDFGLLFGLGYQLENGIGFNARYNLGLTDIFDFSYRSVNEKISFTKKVEEAEVDNFELKNRVLTVSLFYTF